MFSLLSHEEVKEHLLPAMKKYLLRSPEIALMCISCILEALQLDLSQYAEGNNIIINFFLLNLEYKGYFVKIQGYVVDDRSTPLSSKNHF